MGRTFKESARNNIGIMEISGSIIESYDYCREAEIRESLIRMDIAARDGLIVDVRQLHSERDAVENFVVLLFKAVKNMRFPEMDFFKITTSVCIVAADGNFRQRFILSNMNKIFRITDSIEEALSLIRGEQQTK